MLQEFLCRALMVAVVATGIGAGGVGAANAEIISKEYLFNAVTDGPITHHQGGFSYTWDTDLDLLQLDSFDFWLGSVHFTLSDVGIERLSNTFTIGGVLNGPGLLLVSTDDFFFTWNSDGTPGFFNYSLQGLRAIPWGDITLTEINDPVAVPEPAALGLLGAGVVGLGLSARRRRRVAG